MNAFEMGKEVIMKPLIWLLSFLSAVMLTINSYAQNKPDVLKGKRLYRSYCVVCHAVDGKGIGALANKLKLTPADLSSDQYQIHELGHLATIIAGYGKKEESEMPSWGEVLPETDLRDIAAYIPKLNQEGLRFRGHARRGRAIFKSSCVACHGQFGTGEGILAKLIAIPMVDYTKSGNLQNITDEDLINTIQEGKGEYMPPYKDIFDDDEITDVASYVRRLSAMTVTTDTTPQVKPNPLAGKRLYRSYCVVCHAVDGKGKGPLARKLDFTPADLSLEQYQRKEAEDLAAIIGDYRGKEDSDMPSWGEALPETDLRDIAAYIPKLTRQDLRFAGDTHRGRAIYKSSCAACHGQFGTGRGILAKLMKVFMVDFTNPEDMQEISDEELIDIIRKGKGDYMPSWEETFDHRETSDVASYVRMLAR